METNKTTDYESVLADLEAQRAELDSAIAVLKRQLGKSVDQSATTSEASPKHHAHSAGLTPTAFFGLSVADAAIKYLGIVKEDKSTPEIAKALQDHGLKTVSKNFATTVFSALDRREKEEGDIVHPKRGLWGLAAWYPGLRKAKKEENGKKETPPEPVKTDTQHKRIKRERTRNPVAVTKPSGDQPAE